MSILSRKDEIEKKFEEEGIPYHDIDPEMIEILYVLNFELGIKTKFCCYGHRRGEPTSIMFDENETDENVTKILEAVDSNVGISEVKRVRLYKWARTLYQPYYKKPHWTQMNWIFEIDYTKENERQKRLNRITKALRDLSEKMKRQQYA